MDHLAYRRFVALGDSTTEGLGDDPHPDGTPRGWADRLAERLAASTPDLRYANLAVRGKRIAEVRQEQLAPACALGPDMATVIAGINDVIRPRFDLERVLADLDAIHAELRAIGATVVTTTFPDPSRVYGSHRPFRSRILAINDGIRRVAARHGSLVADIADLPLANDSRVWCEDRIHLTPLGHARMADAVGATLAGAAPPASDDAPAPGATSLSAELRWVRRYFAPWVGRRLTGRSSGDGARAKRPELAPPHP